MIEQNGNEDAARAFSAFHDGGIGSVAAAGDAIEAKIDIQYLAERIDPSFRSFYIKLPGMPESSVRALDSEGMLE